jgi:type IV fimbrial biogenesis protein FimT
MAAGNLNRSMASGLPARGFGLIELITVIAIIAVLTVIALPSYQRTLQRNRVISDTNDFMSAVNLARNEAIARGRPVSVCASVNGTSCDGTGIADWSGGYMVFTDFDPVGVVDAGSGDTVLRIIGPVAAHDTIKSTNGSSGYINFTRTGTARFISDAPTEVDFMVFGTPCHEDSVRAISITNFGRAASTTGECP